MSDIIRDGGPAHGMSLLEYYAGEALKAGLSGRWLEGDELWETRIKLAASLAFDVAEAMIEESKKRGKK